MLEGVPTTKELVSLIGPPKYDVWQKLCVLSDGKYDMDRLWNSGGKQWRYEYKYRRGGKTLCALYAKEHNLGVQIIIGKAMTAAFNPEQ